MDNIKSDKRKKQHNFNEKKLNKEQFETLCKLFFLNKKTITKDVKKIKSIPNIEKINKIKDKAKEKGFYYLNSFLLVFKEKIVISQSTFYNRFKNHNIIQYLINNDYIYCYKSIDHPKKDPEKSEKLHFIIDYNKAEEFAELIHNNFLAKSEKNVKLEVRIKKRKKYKKRIIKKTSWNIDVFLFLKDILSINYAIIYIWKEINKTFLNKQN